MLGEGKSVVFSRLFERPTLDDATLGNAEDYVVCMEDILGSVFENRKHLDKATYDSIFDSPHGLLESAGIAQETSLATKDALDAMGRLKLYPLALRLHLCYRRRAFHSEIGGTEAYKDEVIAIYRETRSKLENIIWIIYPIFSEALHTVNPIPRDQVPELLKQLNYTLSKLYDIYEEALSQYYRALEKLVFDAGDTEDAKNEIDCLLKQPRVEQHFQALMGATRSPSPDSFYYSIPKPDLERLAAWLSEEEMAKVNRDLEPLWGHASDLFWSEMGYFVQEHASLSIRDDKDIYLEPGQDFVDGVRDWLQRAAENLAGFKEKQMQTFNALLAKLTPETEEANWDSHALGQSNLRFIIQTVDQASSLLRRVLETYRLRCFGTEFVEAVMDVHRVVCELAKEFTNAIDCFKNTVWNPELRLKLGCLLYGHVVVVTTKLAAWGQVVEDYSKAHEALPSGERELIVGYDQGKVEKLSEGWKLVYVAFPKLFEHYGKEGSVLGKNSYRRAAPEESAAKRAKKEDLPK